MKKKGYINKRSQIEEALRQQRSKKVDTAEKEEDDIARDINGYYYCPVKKRFFKGSDDECLDRRKK